MEGALPKWSIHAQNSPFPPTLRSILVTVESDQKIQSRIVLGCIPDYHPMFDSE
jgi:hypothetical protein